MQLTKYSDYSMRVLIYLALNGDRLVGIEEIAKAFAISRNHLVKVVAQLGKLGYINAKRGPAGGMQLAVAPAEIRLGELIRQTEPHFDIVECFDPEKNECSISPICRLKSILAQASSRFIEELEQYSIADVVGNEEQLAEFIRIEAS